MLSLFISSAYIPIFVWFRILCVSFGLISSSLTHNHFYFVFALVCRFLSFISWTYDLAMEFIRDGALFACITYYSAQIISAEIVLSIQSTSQTPRIIAFCGPWIYMRTYAHTLILTLYIHTAHVFCTHISTIARIHSLKWKPIEFSVKVSGSISDRMRFPYISLSFSFSAFVVVLSLLFLFLFAIQFRFSHFTRMRFSFDYSIRSHIRMLFYANARVIATNQLKVRINCMEARKFTWQM